MLAVAHDEAAFEVEGHTVGAGGTFAEDGQGAGVHVEAVDVRNGGEEEVAVGVPYGAFGEAVSGGQGVRVEVFEEVVEGVRHGMYSRWVWRRVLHKRGLGARGGGVTTEGAGRFTTESTEGELGVFRIGVVAVEGDSPLRGIGRGYCQRNDKCLGTLGMAG